jgi:nicotinamidase-related amidase
MPLTQLDPVPALVLIDLQRGIVGMPTVHPAAQIIGRAASLARAFRERRLPVILVHVTGGAPGRTDTPRPQGSRPADWAELVADLDRQPDDVVIAKERWGAFIGTRLDAVLRERGVTQIVLGGIATSIGVESTARSAYDSGYHVVLVADAMTDRDPESHRNSLERLFPRLGEVTTTADVLAKLANL